MQVLIEEVRDSALLLTMNRPEAMNALSNALVAALTDAIGRADPQPSVRSIIIAASGERAFSAGTDLKERRTLSNEAKADQSQALLRLGQLIQRCSKPVIAAIGGWCLGGGAELALFCDLRIAADDAVIGFPEMTLGAYPGSGGPVTLTRLLGSARAKEVLFTARRCSAQEALAIGLVQRVVPRADLLASALEWSAGIARTAPLAVAALKQSINESTDLPIAQAFALDQKLRRPLDATRDYQEGMLAHFEKRPPRFTGE